MSAEGTGTCAPVPPDVVLTRSQSCTELPLLSESLSGHFFSGFSAESTPRPEAKPSTGYKVPKFAMASCSRTAARWKRRLGRRGVLAPTGIHTMETKLGGSFRPELSGAGAEPRPPLHRTHWERPGAPIPSTFPRVLTLVPRV